MTGTTATDKALSEPARRRAKPLSTDDRRAAIIDAVIPLLMEHGRAVTTRQIAEAAGIAEGTIFRVFVDKDEIIDAAVAKYLDPGVLNEWLRAIDPELSLEGKVNDILFHLRSRMTGIFGIMSAVGMQGPPPRRQGPESFFALIEDILRPDLEQLSVPPDRIASFLRLVAFASAIPHFNDGQELSTAELARYITYGIAGRPAEGGSSNAS
ncbi:MAG TPA: TetR/AcrR family transcriptional regulator [Galbitalea sp.]